MSERIYLVTLWESGPDHYAEVTNREGISATGKSFWSSKRAFAKAVKKLNKLHEDTSQRRRDFPEEWVSKIDEERWRRKPPTVVRK